MPLYYEDFMSPKPRQKIYVSRNIDARLCNHSSRGEAIINTYSECVSVALGIEHEMRMHHIIIRELSGSRICYHIIEIKQDFQETKLLNPKYVFRFSVRSLSGTFLFVIKYKRDTIKKSVLVLIFTDCRKILRLLKFNENLSS
jgi:hypothetical protein